MSKDYIPQHFYVQNKIGNSIAYSQLPIGNISIERIAAGHLKFWQTDNAPDLTYKKKTIIISNQFLSDKTRREPFLNYVKLLIIQEFSCYVASDNTFYPIKTIHDLKKIPLSSNSPPTSRSLKQQLAEQHNLEFDEIHYLTLADLDDSSEYSFKQILSPTMVHNPEIDPEAVLEITNNNELHAPVYDDFLRTKLFSHLIIFWNGSQYMNPLERVTSLSALGKIQLCISHLTSPQDIDVLEGIMPYLSSLLINHNDPAILARLIPKALALENLEIQLINSEKLLNINVPGPFIGPQNLKRLKIDMVFSPYFLELIIKNASQLKEINWTLDPEPDNYDDEIFNENAALLSDINTVVDQSFLQAPHLSELESCALPPINSVCKFLLARSKPIALSIDGSCFSKLEQYCDSNFFNHLQCLNIFSIDENINIKENLKKCLNLSTLKLQGAPNEGSAINLAKLSHFTYQGVYKDHPCKISHILPISPKIELITLESCVFLDSTTQKIPAYPELSEFYVKDSNIQDRNIYNLINNSPNLYSLEIDNRNKEESSAFANLAHNFAKLEELTLRNDDFFFLINRLTSLPLLKILHLKGSINFSIENKEISLPKLRAFYCEDSHLPPHFLSNLNSICPNTQLIVSENISSWLKLIEHLPLDLYPLISISKDKIKYFYGFEEIIVKHLTPTKFEKFNTTLQNLILELLKNKKTEEREFKPPRVRANFSEITQPGASLKYREIFYDNSGPLLADNYRLNIFTKVEINQAGNVFFKTADDTEITPLESFNWLSRDAFLNYEIEPEHYRGDIFIDLTEKWQIIPSYAIDDRLIALYSDVDNQTLEIGWCDKSSSYFIRSSEQVSLNLHVFYKKISPPEYFRGESKNVEGILKLIEHFRSFPEPVMNKPVSLGISENATDIDKFCAIFRKKIGACEQRARAFHFFSAFRPLVFKDIQVRLIFNDIHAFVEIKFKEGWEKFDLGGYPANIEPANLPSFLKTKLENKPLNKTPNNCSQEIKTTLDKSSAISDYLTNNPAKPFPLLPLDNLAAQLYNWKGKNVLINCGINENNSFLEQVFGVQPSNKESILYIAHPEELFIPEHDLVWDRETNKAQSKPKHEPANPLGKLIYSNDEHPILLIDFNAFLVEEIVKWNSLIERDATRFIDQYQLPKSCTVIGLYDLTALKAYDGPDFIERFHHKFNYKAPVLEKNTTPVSLDKPVVINCYEQFDLNILLGNWEFQEEGLMFRRGELIQGLLEGKSHFELRNIPNYEPFTRLLTQMRLTKKIHLFGNTIQLPDNLNISFSTGYQWDWLLKDTLWARALVQNPNIQVVNPSTFSNLFRQYNYDKATKQLIRKPGYLEENKEKEIALYITRKLSLSQWAIFLSYAKHFSIKLRLILAQHVSLPLEINPVITPLSNKAIKIGPLAMLFVTNNVQRAVNEFPRPFDKIIDVSEQPLENLWQRLTPLTSNKENFTFEVLEGVVLKGLLNGEKIALKGDFKPEFIDLLAELLVKQNYITLWGQKQPCTGRLVLFTTPNPHFNFAYSSVKQYSSAPKFEDSPMAMPSYKEEGFGKQRDVLAERFELIEKALENFPYVIIKGHTATGKSTFIINYFSKKYKVYLDEKKWAEDKKTNEPKYLFKDEFNLETGHGLRFTDLFNNKPSITIEEYHELTPYHRIIFAVNPNNNNYSDRKTPLLWERYGFNSITFDPLPSYYLRQSILLPLLSSFPRAIQFHHSTIFLEIGDFINKNFTTNQILITARELKTMVLWLVAYKNKKPLHNLVQPAHYIGYHIAKQVLQPKHFAMFDRWFCKKFKVSLHSLLYHHPFIDNSELILKTNTYFSSPSHHLAWKMLLDCLAVNELGCAGSLAQVFILEGPSGAGKSTFVQAILQKLGIEFTFIRASTSFSKKESLLIDAFINGKKVILDEMNTCIWPRGLIFELLGGRYNGQPPDKPGFMLIATQNSHALSGRKLLDNALTRRLTISIFPAPTFWQQYSIVKQKHPSLFFNSASALIEKAKGNLRKLELDEIGSEVCGPDENKAATRIATAWRSRKTKISFIKKRHLPEEEEQPHPSKKMKLD